MACSSMTRTGLARLTQCRLPTANFSTVSKVMAPTGLEPAATANKTSSRIPAESTQLSARANATSRDMAFVEQANRMPKAPPSIPRTQSPNNATTWSASQNPRSNAMRGPRFEQTNMDFQPQPLSAMALIAEEPIRLMEKRIAECDGGGGSLGHPKVFINLDKPGPKACSYCGIRFERTHHAHGHAGHDKTTSMS